MSVLWQINPIKKKWKLQQIKGAAGWWRKALSLKMGCRRNEYFPIKNKDAKGDLSDINGAVVSDNVHWSQRALEDTDSHRAQKEEHDSSYVHHSKSCFTYAVGSKILTAPCSFQQYLSLLVTWLRSSPCKSGSLENTLSDSLRRQWRLVTKQGRRQVTVVMMKEEKAPKGRTQVKWKTRRKVKMKKLSVTSSYP